VVGVAKAAKTPSEIESFAGADGIGGSRADLVVDMNITPPPPPQRYGFWWAIGNMAVPEIFAEDGQFGIHPQTVTVNSQFSNSWPRTHKDGTQVNGGVPQAGNLSMHLEGWSACVNNEMHGGPATCTNAPGGFWDCVPPKFDGNCVIDFEEYNGVWEETYPRYQNASLKLVRQQHPGWSAAQVTAVAKAEFEAAAVEFLVATVKRGKELRPKCTW
jgi:hypothetical protein